MFIDYQWGTDTATPYACWEDMGVEICGSGELDEIYRKNLYTGINKIFSLDNVIYSTSQGKLPYVNGAAITKVRSLLFHKNWTNDFSHDTMTVIAELRVCSYKRQLVTREYIVPKFSDKASTIRGVIHSCERNYIIDAILFDIQSPVLV